MNPWETDHDRQLREGDRIAAAYCEREGIPVTQAIRDCAAIALRRPSPILQDRQLCPHWPHFWPNPDVLDPAAVAEWDFAERGRLRLCASIRQVAAERAGESWFDEGEAS